MPLGLALGAAGIGLSAASAAGAFGEPSVPGLRNLSMAPFNVMGRPLSEAEIAELAGFRQREEQFSLLCGRARRDARFTPSERSRFNQLVKKEGLLGGLARLQAGFFPQFEQNVLESFQRQAPEFFTAREALGQEIGRNVGQGLSPAQLAFFRNQIGQGQALRGLFDSPLGSAQEAQFLTDLELQQQQRNIENALNYQQSFRFMSAPGGTAINALTPPSYNDLINLNQSRVSAQNALESQRQQAFGQLGGQIAGLGTAAASGALGSFWGGPQPQGSQLPPASGYVGGGW